MLSMAILGFLILFLLGARAAIHEADEESRTTYGESRPTCLESGHKGTSFPSRVR